MKKRLSEGEDAKKEKETETVNEILALFYYEDN